MPSAADGYAASPRALAACNATGTDLTAETPLERVWELVGLPRRLLSSLHECPFTHDGRLTTSPSRPPRQSRRRADSVCRSISPVSTPR